MTTDEDVLLREVNEDLQQDNQIAFIKTYGPWLAAAALIIVVGVGSVQFLQGKEERENAISGEAYTQALLESVTTPDVAADALLQAQDQYTDGYRALAGLRRGALLMASEKPTEALSAYGEVYNDAALPVRMRDLARLRAGLIRLDTDAPGAQALAQDITTIAFLPYANEIKALASLSAGDYDTAFALLSSLSNDPAVPSGLSARARYLAPIADAGRSGVKPEPEVTESEAFMRSFSDQLEADLANTAAEIEAVDGAQAPAP